MYIHEIKLDNRNGKDFSFERPQGVLDYLYLIFKSPVFLTIRTQLFSINAPTAILIDSNTPHKYISMSDEYADDYFHFVAEDKQLFSEALTFPVNTPILLADYEDISSILNLIHWEFRRKNDNEQSEEALEALTKYLMIKTGRNWSNMSCLGVETLHHDKLIKIRELILSRPEQNWSINELAKSANLSPTYFQVLYRRTFGTSCINDKIQARVSRAQELLLSTDHTVKEISNILGYSVVYHFIRQFKKNVGLSPNVFRKKM